jgi:Zn ribbon nucleic-acid-binding protein
MNDMVKFGFRPNAYCNVAGVVAGGQDRQDVLRAAEVFAGNQATLTLDNGGLRLVPDPSNPYDRYAIKVLLATKLDYAGKPTDLQAAGFIPRAACPVCWTSWGGKRADALNCVKCGAEMPPMKFNEFLSQAIADGREVRAGVDWISDGSKGSYGCRLALEIL